jgi:hypothetical protein
MREAMPARVIRSLNDFLGVPEAELKNCLAAFRRAIQVHKAMQGAGSEAGAAAAGLPFLEFVWRPKENNRPAPSTVTPTSPVDALGLKPAAVRKFREMNLYALEDFAQATERELRTVPDVGPSTVTQIREMLQEVGLTFRPPAHPWARAEHQAKVARALGPSERARHISDDSGVGALGLKGATLTRCMEKGIITVGQLRRMTLRDLFIPFGTQSLIDLMNCLDAVSMPLQSHPGQLERWRYKAIAREALTQPADTDNVRELEPWLGSLPRAFERAGVHTVGELRRIADGGGHEIRGVGQASWDRVFDYFGIQRRTVKRRGEAGAAQ